MKRYMPVVETKFDHIRTEYERTKREGDYVRYEDAQDQIISAQVQIAVKTDCLVRALDLADTALEKVIEFQRQLAEVTRERDTLKAMVDLHDAMNDRRRAQANETPFKRRKYENG